MEIKRKRKTLANVAYPCCQKTVANLRVCLRRLILILFLSHLAFLYLGSRSQSQNICNAARKKERKNVYVLGICCLANVNIYFFV
jgi:hypothetical protein